MPLDRQLLSRLKVTEPEMLDLLAADVKEIFTTMVGMDPPLTPTLPALDQGFQGCVSAMICLSGSYNGVVSLHATPRAAVQITSQMLGMEIAEVDGDVTDAMGEIANMIGGCFKHHFVNDGHEVRLTPPTILPCNDRFRAPDPEGEHLSLLFDAGADYFLVTVHLEAWD